MQPLKKCSCIQITLKGYSSWVFIGKEDKQRTKEINKNKGSKGCAHITANRLGSAPWGGSGLPDTSLLSIYLQF